MEIDNKELLPGHFTSVRGGSVPCLERADATDSDAEAGG